MGKNDKDKQRPKHDGPVAPADAELSEWLNRLWHRGAPPERIEVYQLFGHKNYARGELIYHEDFKPGEKLDIEQANKLANDIVAACQHDTDCARKTMNYQLVIKDNNRTATPLTRRHGPVVVKRALLMKSDEAGDDDDEEEGIVTGKSLSLAYIKGGMAQVQWEKSRLDTVLGEVLLLMKDRGDRAEARLETMIDKVLGFFDKLQEAQDRSLDREIVREKEKFKIGLWRDGSRTVRNLLPGLFAAAKEDAAQSLPENSSANSTNGNSTSTSAPKFGSSTERSLLDNFFADVEEMMKEKPELDSALFGDYEKGPNGERIEKKKGIFSFEQCYILLGVREGHLSPDELDKLVPKSPGEPQSGLEITPAQIIAAGQAGVTEGMGLALLEIVQFRRSKKLNTAPAEAAAPTTPTTEGPTP